MSKKITYEYNKVESNYTLINEYTFENSEREIFGDYDGDTNYKEGSYHESVVDRMSKEYQTRLRSKNRSKNKAARASRKRNRK